MTSPAVLLHPVLSRTPAAPVVRVVPPDAVPAGATVIGVLVMDAVHASAVLAPPVPAPAVPASAVPAPRSVPRPDAVTVDADTRQVWADGVLLDLTRREFDLLQRLNGAPGRVFPRERLLREVWGYDSDAYVSGRTVDVHVTRLRRKLGVHAPRLQTVRGVGYRWTASAGI